VDAARGPGRAGEGRRWRRDARSESADCHRTRALPPLGKPCPSCYPAGFDCRVARRG
jgi:hypothetical protein